MDIDQGTHHGHGDEFNPPGPFSDHPHHHQALNHHSHHHSHSSSSYQHHNSNSHSQNYRLGGDLNLDLDPAPESERERHPERAQPEPRSYPAPADKPFSPAPPFDTRPSQIPILHALAAANASPSLGSSSTGHVHAPPSPVDPDDFYRGYRGVQTAGNDSLSPSLANDSMASAIPSNRPPQSQPTRPNGTPTASKIPSAPTAHRNALRPSYRAASNPVDDRLGNAAATKPQPATGYAAGATGYPPSVKDLKKRFDQTSSPSASTARKTSTNTPRPARDTVSTATNGRSQASGGGATSYSALRASTTRDTGHEPGKASGTRATQRSKFVAEDQLSSNSQSFASRISRPRNEVSPNRQTSRSMTRISSRPSPNLSTSPPPPPRANGLLFGEILPEDSDSAVAGYGIEPPRPRRTSESNVQDLDRPRLRSFSDPDVDVEPSSPTDWYRGAVSSQHDADSNSAGTAANHAPSQSDAAGSKPPNIYTDRRQHTDLAPASPASPTSPTSPTSRLPIMMKRMSNSSNPSNDSTRPNSPAAAKYAPGSGRTSRQHGTLAARAKTPTTRSITPSNLSKTHNSNPPGSSRKPPPSNITTPSSGRLNAYVSAVPAPKLSPSLRSSRPRQSVATATTTASRMRAVDGPTQSQKPGQRRNSKTDDSASSTRRRKVSVGPIDFAQRRETIKLAYSKSIRESQAREARQAAAERRKKELEVVAQIKAEAEAEVAAVASAASSQAGENQTQSTVERVAPQREKEPKIERTIPEEPLRITTNLGLLQPRIEKVTTHLDSPTLGIPGSFPDVASPPLLGQEDFIPIPHSAVSTRTYTTEFDPDEQTEPPRRESVSESLVSASLAAIDNDLGIVDFGQTPSINEPQFQAHTDPPTLQKRASYHSPFDVDDELEDGDVSIKISLDDLTQSSPQLTPTRTEFQGPHSTLSQPTEDEYEPQPYRYSSPVYQTTVTILGPENEFKPLYRDQINDDMTSPNPNQPDAAPAMVTQGIVSHGSSSAGLLFEEPSQEIDTMERLEDFYVGPRLRDNIASLRDSTFTSSEPDISYDGQPSSSEFQKTPDTSNSLSVPNYLTPGNRLSHTSAWTDFSFGSDDRIAGPASSTTHSHDLNRSEEKLAPLSTPEIGGLGIQGSSSPRASSESLSFGIINTSDPPMLADALIGSSKLSLQQDYGHADVQGDYSGGHSRDEYDLDDSSYVGVTRPSSYLHDQDDESEDLTLAPSASEQSSLENLEPVSTIQSIETPLSAEARDSLDKEHKRLRQRQLVIRELIDTEDTFVRDMSVVEEIYKGTAEACPNLDNKTIKLVFRNTDEIIAFHQAFLAQLKDGASSVYTPKGRRSPLLGQEPKDSDSATMNSGHSGASLNKPELDDDRDRQTCLGPLFSRNIGQLKQAHEAYLKTSDASTKRLLQIQEDATVKVWLTECNQVAKELTSAWNLDSLLIKPMQRITKYPDIITHLLKYTPDDHPDYKALIVARTTVINAIDEINKSKKNFELVGQLVGPRKRKDSDVRAGIARAFGKRVDKLQISSIKTADDDEFQKLHAKCHEDFLRLQFVLRDIEFYTRDVTTYVLDFLKYLSAMELVMRLQPSREFAHLESKWVQFNVSMRDIENIALEKHLGDVRKHVIEPFEQVIKCYNNPLLAMKKRSKRRLDYDKYLQLKANGKKVDKQLNELAEQYEALNDTLKKELPKLSELTAKVGNICMGKFVSIQTTWYSIWKEKVKGPLQDVGHIPELSEIVNTFQREFMLQEERVMAIGIVNPALKGRTSQSTTDDASSTLSKSKSRANDHLSPRGRGLSINSDHNIPSLPTPDFAKRNSGQFSLSPTTGLPSPGHYYRDYYSGVNGHAHGGSSPITTEASASGSVTRSATTLSASVRPNTGRSYESMSLPRQSSDSTALTYAQSRRDSNSTFNSSAQPQSGAHETRRLSGLFHSALPLPDGPDEESRASSGDRAGSGLAYKVLWLAASLFEFNIETTKHEAGYPYLTYQAGEIFDVMAEKGELWLAKNQDDPGNGVGWIWSKHFAKLADA